MIIKVSKGLSLNACYWVVAEWFITVPQRFFYYSYGLNGIKFRHKSNTMFMNCNREVVVFISKKEKQKEIAKTNYVVKRKFSDKPIKELIMNKLAVKAIVK